MYLLFGGEILSFWSEMLPLIHYPPFGLAEERLEPGARAAASGEELDFPSFKCVQGLDL